FFVTSVRGPLPVFAAGRDFDFRNVYGIRETGFRVANSALASRRMGVLGSASFQREKKSSYARAAFVVSPDIAYARPSSRLARFPTANVASGRWARIFSNSTAAAAPWCDNNRACPRRYTGYKVAIGCGLPNS